MFFIKEYLFIRLTYSKKLAIIYRIMITEVTDMPQNKGPFYMTTAIAYTSGKPHIGNTYEIVLADSIARFRRQEGYDVFFQTGTDEHGQKIELKAEEAGITPKEFVDNVSTEIKRIWDLMDTSYDKFIRTTDDYHEKQVQKIFKKLYDQEIYIRVHTKVCTVHLASLSGQSHSLLTENVLTADVKLSQLRKKLISLR